MTEPETRQAIVQWSRSLFERGYTAGSSGNISARVEDGFIVTPTNSCLGFLEVDRLSKLDRHGAHISGDRPTKELPLHMAFYEARPDTAAVAHLHSTHATALSCLTNIDPENVLPPITPYLVMRVGRVALVPYTRPGSDAVAPLIRAKAAQHIAILLGNHGPVVAGSSLENAVFGIEELEETAKLVFLTRGQSIRVLSADDITELDRAFRLK